jgi:hypothetical protein
LTINPIDYEDPVAQIFTGENNNMDAFSNMMGPCASKWVENMVKDSFVSAFFSGTSFRHVWNVYVVYKLLVAEWNLNWGSLDSLTVILEL